MSVIWGIPYLFIKIAVTELSPAAVAGGRTLLAALILVPLAARQGALRPALRLWPWAVAFGLIEMAIPWLLLGQAETRVPSGFAGLMLATVPIVATLLAVLRREPGAVAPVRLLGLATGVLGVAALVGLDSIAGHVDLLSVLELLGVAIGYAMAPVIAARRLADVPSMGVIAFSVGVVALLYLPVTVPAFAQDCPPPTVVGSVVVLGLVCTALAFVLFFRLLAHGRPDPLHADHVRQPRRRDAARRPGALRTAHLGHGRRLPARPARLVLGHTPDTRDGGRDGHQPYDRGDVAAPAIPVVALRARQARMAP